MGHLAKNFKKNIAENNLLKYLYVFLAEWVLQSLFSKKRVWSYGAKFLLRNIIFLHCLTSGKATDRISNSISEGVPDINDKSRYFIDQKYSLDTIVKEVEEKGFFVIESVIPQEICKSIVNYALTEESTPREVSGLKKIPPCIPVEPFLSARYDFSRIPISIFKNKIIQDLIADPFIINIAQRYLKCRPFLDPIELWWLFPFSMRDQNWAEEYHFDMDTLKWIKFFINFEEIELENGPHCFIEGSHLSGAIPGEILNKGYSRTSDNQVFAHYSKERERKFIVPAGSLLIEDTRGLHKGLTPTKGRRLLLSIQYSNILLKDGLFPLINEPFEVSELFGRRLVETPHLFQKHIDFNTLRKMTTKNVVS